MCQGIQVKGPSAFRRPAFPYFLRLRYLSKTGKILIKRNREHRQLMLYAPFKNSIPCLQAILYFRYFLILLLFNVCIFFETLYLLICDFTLLNSFILMFFERLPTIDLQVWLIFPFLYLIFLSIS